MNRACATLFAVTLIALTPARSQEPAKSQSLPTPAQAPAIRGIKLGMSAQEILSLFPGSGERPDIKYALDHSEGFSNYGVATFSFHLKNHTPADKLRFAGVNILSVTLFDGRVAELWVDYTSREDHPSGPTWFNVDDFIA